MFKATTRHVGSGGRGRRFGRIPREIVIARNGYLMERNVGSGGFVSRKHFRTVHCLVRHRSSSRRGSNYKDPSSTLAVVSYDELSTAELSDDGDAALTIKYDDNCVEVIEFLDVSAEFKYHSIDLNLFLILLLRAYLHKLGNRNLLGHTIHSLLVHSVVFTRPHCTYWYL